MGWLPDKSLWHVHIPGPFARLPSVGIDGQPLKTEIDGLVMRRIVRGEAQYRAITDAERIADAEDWALGVF